MTDEDWAFLKQRYRESKNVFLTDAMRPQFEEMVRKGELLQVHIFRGILTDNITEPKE